MGIKAGSLMYVSVIEMEISVWECEKKFSLRKLPIQKIVNRVETISDGC